VFSGFLVKILFWKHNPQRLPQVFGIKSLILSKFWPKTFANNLPFLNSHFYKKALLVDD